MKRALTVVLIAVLTAVISGINETSLASQSQDAQAEAHRQKISTAVRAIPIGSPIEVDPVRGGKFQALLESVAPDAINVRLVTGNYAVTRTIPFDEIQNLKKIRKIGSHRGRNIAVLVGVAVAVVLVGACANAISADMSQGARPRQP